MGRINTLIKSAELAALPVTGRLLVDCRFDLSDPARGERDYRAGHLRGAVYAHLERDLSAPPTAGLGRHPVPDEADFSAALSRWGWQPGRLLIAYDAAGGALAAARFWWLARLAGITEVAVLDGGFAAAQTVGIDTDEGEPPPQPPSPVKLHYRHESMLDHHGLQQRLAAPACLLLDARAAPRYRGEVEPIDAVAGHIPGARNRPFGDNLQADGCFKSSVQLRAEFESYLDGRAPTDVIHMCGSGVTACHNLLAMEYAGLSGSLLYPPSWSGWIADPTRPRARGARA